MELSGEEAGMLIEQGRRVYEVCAFAGNYVVNGWYKIGLEATAALDFALRAGFADRGEIYVHTAQEVRLIYSK